MTVLVGGIGTLAADKPPVKTVGSYWPYATTLFDYIRRAMPFDRTEIADQRRGLRGVGLHPAISTGSIGADDVLDAQSLPKVKMPNRDGFIPFPRAVSARPSPAWGELEGDGLEVGYL